MPSGDPLSGRARSVRMATIKGRGNASTELALARILRAEGITGWRRHLDLPGRPDFYFPKARVAVLVHGCFWHGCKACKRRLPLKRASFWSRKLEGNRRRDKRVLSLLKNQSVRSLVVWEHELRNPPAMRHVLLKLKRYLSEPLSTATGQ